MLSLVVSPELGDIYCSDYSFTINTRCSYPTTERKSDFETKTKRLLSIILIEKVQSNRIKQDFALKRADCCFGALKVVLRLGCCDFTLFGKPGVKKETKNFSQKDHFEQMSRAQDTTPIYVNRDRP